MELVERYLHAVRFWLPAEQRDDVAAELAADIYSEIEDEAAQLGRDLTPAEVAALLLERGRPLLVAAHYLPQRSLIGPLLFPLYLFVLKIVALCSVIPSAVVWVILVATSPSSDWWKKAGMVWGTAWTTVFVAFGVVTMVFAVLERTQSRTHFLEQWDPLKLPPVRDPNQIPRLSSAIELIAGLAGAIWMLVYLWPPLVLGPIEVTLDPSWRYFYWGFLAVSLANTALSSLNWLKPYWDVPRAAAKTLFDIAGSGMFCAVLKADLITHLSVPNVSEGDAAGFVSAIHHWSNQAFPVAVIIGAVILGANLFRLQRLSRASSGGGALGPLAGPATL